MNTLRQDLITIFRRAQFAQSLPDETSLDKLASLQLYLKEQIHTIGQGESKIVRDFLVLQFVTEQITDGLSRERYHHNLPAPLPGMSQQQALQEIERDFRQDAPRLEAWSVLYFLYARVDLCLTTGDLARAGVVHKRTIRYRRTSGAGFLSYRLLELEHNLLRQSGD